ncbi:MAG TPA: phage tail protein [Pseudonocardiaceae bacterium]
MRTELSGLPTPHPIGERLPAVYQENDFVQEFTAALDEVLAPVFVTLDCFAGYLDPWLAPADFVDWLAGWVAVHPDEGRPLEQRRELVAGAVELHRWRGTRRGLLAHVRLLTGGDVELVDSGGCTHSDEPGGPLPGSAAATVTVRVRVADPAAVDQDLVRAAVAELVPAHITVEVEVRGAS